MQGNRKMFERDLYGLNPNLTYPFISGSASTRKALDEQRYLDGRRTRLTREAEERRRLDVERRTGAAIAAIVRLIEACRSAIGTLRASGRAHLN